MRKLVALFVLLTCCGHALAEVTATVDRNVVELNESFTLRVKVDTQLDAEPQMDVLDADFHVGPSNSITNTTILNGEIMRSRTWSFALMARQAGELVIPPITVGNEQSEPITVTVNPQSTAPPGEADIFISAAVDVDSAYVQGQVLYTVRTYRAVATRQPRWSEPTVSGVEALVEIAGEEKTYESILDGKAYAVNERVYAFFPQQSGELNISPARFEARVLRDGRITGRKVYQSESVSVNVLPIPAPPADYPDAAWFPATAVQLREEWSRDPAGLKAGEPITRHITVIADGQLETQIPVIEPAVAENLRIYPDKPEMRKAVGHDGVRALRRDQYAMIGTAAGEVVLPGLALPWWNTTTGAWDVATLPESTLEILPSTDFAEPPPQEAVAQTPVELPPQEIVYVENPLWRYLSIGLGAAWVLTLAGIWIARQPRQKTVREPAPVPPYKLQAKHLKAARKAAVDGDAATVRSELLEWARIQWPNNAPRNIGDIAEQVSLPLSTELQRLCSASYGTTAEDWNGEALAKALKSFSVLDDGDSENQDALPPLMPAN